MTFDEYFDSIIGYADQLLSLARANSASTIVPGEWYAGITGQEDDDNDGKADRENAHPVQEGTWVEIEVHYHQVAKDVEDELHRRGFRGDGGRGNMSLKPTIVYLYKINFIQVIRNLKV